MATIAARTFIGIAPLALLPVVVVVLLVVVCTVVRWDRETPPRRTSLLARLWRELIGERVSRPNDPPVWTDYQRHVHYRNAIAHGSKWGDGWGWESVAAAGQFIIRLDSHALAVPGP